MRFLSKYYIIALFITTGFITAQEKTIPIELTLNEAINIALENNWDVKLSNKDILRAEEQINEAYANAFPTVSLNGRYVRNIKMPVLFIQPGNPFNPTDQTQTIELGADNSFDATISLTQVLYSQKVNTAIKIANEYSELSKTADKGTKNDLILNVKKAFYNVLLMKELVKVSKQGHEVAKANYDNISALYKQGVASEYDYLRAEVQLANTQPALIKTENALELSKNYLKNLLTIDVNRPIEVKGEFVYIETPESYIEEASENAVQVHPLVQQLEIQSSLLEKNVTIQRSDYFPTLAAFGQYSFQSQDNTFKFNDYRWAKSFMVGLNLSYTLFDGFSM